MHATISSDQTVEIRGIDGKLCGTYHNEDPFQVTPSPSTVEPHLSPV